VGVLPVLLVGGGKTLLSVFGAGPPCRHRCLHIDALPLDPDFKADRSLAVRVEAVGGEGEGQTFGVCPFLPMCPQDAPGLPVCLRCILILLPRLLQLKDVCIHRIVQRRPNKELEG
jgi:hypothetical protein